MERRPEQGDGGMIRLRSQGILKGTVGRTSYEFQPVDISVLLVRRPLIHPYLREGTSVRSQTSRPRFQL